MSIRKKALGSALSGNRLGSKPSKEELREEVQRLREQGLDSQEIGQQIGVYYIKEQEKQTLDKLEEVLTEEFEDYGGDS